MTSVSNDEVAIKLLEMARLDKDSPCTNVVTEPEFVQAGEVVLSIRDLLRREEKAALLIRLVHKHFGCDTYILFFSELVETPEGCRQMLYTSFWLLMHLVTLEIKSLKSGHDNV